MTKVMTKVSADEKLLEVDDTEETESALIADLEEMDADMTEMRRDSASIDTKVVPRGDKWWRYRWEYSFVESILLMIIIVLVIIWEGIHKLLRRMVKRRSMLSPFYITEDEATLYTTWWHYMMGEMFVLLLVVMSMAILARWGLFDIWLEIQMSSSPEFHMPTTTQQYMREALEILMQLGVALVLFFGLTLMIVITCVNREIEWNMMEVEGGAVARQTLSAEAQMEVDEGGESSTQTRVRANEMVRLACGSQELLSLKMMFFAGANCCPEFMDAMDGVPQHKFHFWHYLSMSARTGVESVYEISLTTWFIFLCSMIIFCVIYRTLKLAWVQIMIGFGIIMLIVLAYMWVYVKREVAQIDLHGSLETMPRQQHEPRNPCMSQETFVGLMLQFPTFFIAYSLARLICSSWTWIHYARTALCCAVCGVAFFFIYRLIIAPVAITFFVVTSLPPHMDHSHIIMVERTAAYSAEQVKLHEQGPTAKRRARTPRPVSKAGARSRQSAW